MLDIIDALGQNEAIVKTIAPIFLLGFLIFIHEFGHFLFAKIFGVGVERFSFGFGPRIFGFERNGTDYRVSWIPLGGYVKMVGDDPFEDVEPEMRERSFLHKAIWKKLIIVLAGPLFNLILPVVLFAGLYMAGAPEPTTWVGTVLDGSPASAAGIEVGERIVAVNGQPVRYFSELREAVTDLPLGARASLTLERDGQQRQLEVTLKPEPGTNEWGDRIEQNTLGVAPTGAKAYIGVQPVPSSPAWKAGLRPRDQLLTIDGKEVGWWFEAQQLLAANQAPSIEVTVQRGDETIRATLSRAAVSSDGVAGAPVPASDEVARLHPGAAFGLWPYELFIDKVMPDKPAARAGLKDGDMIYSINGTAVHRWYEVKRLIEAPADQAKEMIVLRNGQWTSVSVKPEVVTTRDAYGQARQEGQIGIMPVDVYGTDQVPLRLNPIAALARGAKETATVTYVSGRILGRIIVGDIPLTESLGGPISIVTAAAQSAWISVFQYVRVMALISVSLGLINLLPIPLLDGGHILFFTLEFIRGRPVSMRFREVSQQVGLILLFILMAFALANDVRMNLLR